MRDPAWILALLCLFIAVSEILTRKTALRHIGTALLVILVTALAANLGIIPAGSTDASPVPLYDGIFAFIAPLAIFWLLLLVNLREVMRAGAAVVGLFLIGAAGVAAGAVLAGRLLPLEEIGPLHAAVNGMFVGTYIGGSINFNAIGLHYGVVRAGGLYAGTVAVDNVVTTVWMVATLAMPRVLAPLWPRRVRAAATAATHAEDVRTDTESLHAIDLAVLGTLGLASLFVAGRLAAATAVPAILYLTIIALLLAQVPAIARLRGTRVLGMFAVYLFLAVIGAFCDVRQLATLGRLGMLLLGLASIIVLVHGVVVLMAARLLRIDLDVAAIASQANVGGATSALALARTLGRQDLVLAAVLIGSLGNAVGTFIGFWVAARTP